MSNYIVNTVLVESWNVPNALAGIEGQVDQDVCYVQQVNRYYRWFSASTATADGSLVVIPEGQSGSDPGRWIRQGPPGPNLVDPGIPASLKPKNPIRSVTVTFAGSETSFSFAADFGSAFPAGPVIAVAVPRDDTLIRSAVCTRGSNPGEVIVSGTCVSHGPGDEIFDVCLLQVG